MGWYAAVRDGWNASGRAQAACTEGEAGDAAAIALWQQSKCAQPPKRDPRTDPGARPGGDIPPEAPAGPGFPGGGPPKTPPFDRVESIDIIDGKYLPSETPYAVWDGTIHDDGMSQVHYRTDTPCLNGVYIGGDSIYQISRCSFSLRGYGINDFAGIGSAVMTDGTSQVVIRDTELVTSGALRPCMTADGTSVVTLENCRLYAAGGALPEGYRPRIGAGMMEPPPGMGIGGTCRASVLLGGAKMYYKNCTIEAGDVYSLFPNFLRMWWAAHKR